MNKDCALCVALKKETELAWTMLGFSILKTNNMKGHAGRLMIVSETHRRDVLVGERNYAIGFLFRYIVEKGGGYDWAIMDSTHASIPDHWHLVATTLDEGEDKELVWDTPRIELRFMSQWSKVTKEELQ